MFDLERMGMPIMVTAHDGSRWLALYRAQTTDEYHAYIAVPAAEEGGVSKPLPQPCSLISVPLSEQEREDVRKRKEREAAQDAARKGRTL